MKFLFPFGNFVLTWCVDATIKQFGCLIALPSLILDALGGSMWYAGRLYLVEVRSVRPLEKHHRFQLSFEMLTSLLVFLVETLSVNTVVPEKL